MKRRGLLIGSQTYGLEGVHRDVEHMKQCLARFEVDCDLRTGGDATRAGIIDGYRRLIRAVAPQDAAVIYYSGHGAYARNQEAGESGPFSYQFIVPTDMDQTTEEDFRGILDFELSRLLAELTLRTRNVTVILDCCHSARMSRDPVMVPRALPKSWFLGIPHHVAALQSRDDFRDVESNPFAVRLAAAGIHQSAYEYESARHGRVGMFTEALTMALEQAEIQEISWAVLGRRVREQVLAKQPVQRPELEGPADRALFSCHEIRREGVLTFFYDPVPDHPERISSENTFLRGGRLAGAEQGNVYGLMPPDSVRFDQERKLGTARVIEVQGGRSRVILNADPWVPQGVPAFLLEEVLPGRPIHLEDEESSRTLGEALMLEPLLCVAGAGDADQQLLATVRCQDGLFHIRDESGMPTAFPHADPMRVTKNLTALARARNLREMTSGEGVYTLMQPFDYEWGRVEEGEAVPLPITNALVHNGDRVYVRVTNRGTTRLFVNLIDIGVSRSIGILNRSQLSGVAMEPGESYCFGQRAYDQITGNRMRWPKQVPDDGPRLETIVVVVSDQPQDLTVLESQGVQRFFGSSPLQQMLIRAGQGVTREVSWEEEADVRYAIRFIDFTFHPGQRPAGPEPRFWQEDRPDPSLLVNLPRSLAPPPVKLAVRLKELIVHRNRALGAGDIRVDVMCTTQSTDDEQPMMYQLGSMSFPDVRDETPLPFDRLLVYSGPVRDYLDFAIWVSRERDKNMELASRIGDFLGSSPFKTAATVLGGIATCAPQTAGVLALANATSGVFQFVSDLLNRSMGKSIGLYRASWLFRENFGIGQMPMKRIRDFSLALEIVEI